MRECQIDSDMNKYKKVHLQHKSLRPPMVNEQFRAK